MLSGELVDVVAAAAGGLGVTGLVHAYIRHRTRLRVERERSRRTEARARGLVRLARRHRTVVLDERDTDGHRVLRVGGRARRPGSRKEAA